MLHVVLFSTMILKEIESLSLLLGLMNKVLMMCKTNCIVLAVATKNISSDEFRKPSRKSKTLDSRLVDTVDVTVYWYRSIGYAGT